MGALPVISFRGCGRQLDDRGDRAPRESLVICGPGRELLLRDPVRAIRGDHRDPRVAMIERELDRDRIRVAIGRRQIVEEHGVHVGALGEATAVRIEPMHLLTGPLPVLFVLPGMDPIDRHIGARVDGIRDLAPTVGESQILQLPRRDPATAGEEPGPHHASGVEMVALVPAVVGDLVSRIRVDQGEQHAPDLDRTIFHGALLGIVQSIRGQRSNPPCVSKDRGRTALSAADPNQSAGRRSAGGGSR